jgi:DNA recombination protein RmuC
MLTTLSLAAILLAAVLYVLNRATRTMRKDLLEGMLALSGSTTTSLHQSLSGINETLRQLHSSIGEVQALRSDVGDLRKVFSNVKSRGGWGEVQIESILEDLLQASQYEKNFEAKPGSGQRVEFAVKMPGNGNGEPVWMPIDSKFPTEDYIRLVEASAAGDTAQIEQSQRAIEACVRECAKTIHDKYINPPRTTDLAILFLPSEGLYAEVLRRPGLAEQLQRDYRIMVAGPTNLFAILNCLSVGFRTAAVEERAEEIHRLLGAVRREFQILGHVVDRSKRQAQTVVNGIEDVEARFRSMEKTLKSVQNSDTDDSLLTARQGDLRQTAVNDG